jgi:hypothetical protein
MFRATVSAAENRDANAAAGGRNAGCGEIKRNAAK